jgi:transcription initiation factor TFIID subunit 1
VAGFHGKKDPFNISNDEYYNPKHVSNGHSLLSGLEGMVVQHSTPALHLYPPWFPTHLNSSALRHFHRPKLRIRCPRGENSTGWYGVTGLESFLALKAKEREKERTLSGGGEVFFMRHPEDLSSCDGHIVLAEYCEQHPPLMSAIGLATKIKNYYRRSEVRI